MDINRRGFLFAGGAAVLAGAATGAETAAAPQLPTDPYKGTKGAPFAVGAPCLQAPAETTMGVSWAVSGLSKGVVEVSEKPDMADAKTFKAGGYGLVPIDIASQNVRLEGLRPGTKYYYRTITTPFTDYENIYKAKLGEPVVSFVHSFTTMGADAPAHFCVINDTHAKWEPFQLCVKKVKELKPAVLVWNGDATNTTQDKATAVEIFLDPPVADRDYAADIPVCFESGNHDFRGSWISKKEEVMMARHPAERRGDQWDLKWNFAFRLGDLALIGMDTGEDKPDGHPKWFGLANFEPYRRAQAAWLEEALARPDIAAAKRKVLFCHIPLFAAADHPDYPHDGVKIDPDDFAYWSRECHDLWVPIFERGGVTTVIAAHKHHFRCDRAEPGRGWTQFVGGSPTLKCADPARYPTVIEGKAEADGLRIRVHNVESGTVVFDEIV